MWNKVGFIQEHDWDTKTATTCNLLLREKSAYSPSCSGEKLALKTSAYDFLTVAWYTSRQFEPKASVRVWAKRCAGFLLGRGVPISLSALLAAPVIVNKLHRKNVVGKWSVGGR